MKNNPKSLGCEYNIGNWCIVFNASSFLITVITIAKQTSPQSQPLAKPNSYLDPKQILVYLSSFQLKLKTILLF